MLKIELIVRVDDGAERSFACIEVPYQLLEYFRPLNISDGCFGPDESVSSSQAETFIRVREDVSRVLSEELANMISNVMKSRDTINGYCVSKEGKDGRI